MEAKKYIGWIAALIVALVAFAFSGAIVGAWAFRHVDQGGSRLPSPFKEWVLSLASIPGQVKTAFLTIAVSSNSPAFELVIPESAWNNGNRRTQFPEPSDLGFLLLSGLDPQTNRANVRLIRIADGETVLRWDPDWEFIHGASEEHPIIAPKGAPAALRAVHPELLDDGSVLFNTGIALVRQERCAKRPAWVLNGIFHHSNERAADGSLWTPSVNLQPVPDYQHPLLRKKLRDDALAQISPDGKLLRRISFSAVLRDNGLDHLILGFGGLRFLEDPIHINQISPALTDTAHWKKDDLLISARHLSAVFLYRPSTNKIIWYKIGPWMNQHAAAFVDGQRISVFDNNVFSAPISDPPFINASETNRVWVYNFATDELSQPFADSVGRAQVKTVTEGRGHIVSGNRLFVEETNYGRHLMLTEKGTQWSRLNQLGTKNALGAVAWSRYIEEDVGQHFVELAKAPCPTPN
jgi:hypothetical protein